jgi:hypothetical protein
VNGSAFIRLPDGEMFKLGYAGKNGREYASLGKALVDAKELPKDNVNLQSIREWARKNPAKVQAFLDKNDSYVFFQPIEGNPHGSLNVPVTGGRSIATDKRLFPRGAITWAQARTGKDIGAQLDRFLLDQDTGGAIRTAGRGDVYLGRGRRGRAPGGRDATGRSALLPVPEGRRAAPAVNAGVVLAVCLGPGGIPKFAVDSAVVERLGLVGDKHRFIGHGGANRAVCLFAIEDYVKLRNDGVPCEKPGTFGENLLTEGLDYAALRPDDELLVGDEVRLAIHDVREPCGTLKKVDKRFPDLMIGRSGLLCRVVNGGVVRPGMTVRQG